MAKIMVWLFIESADLTSEEISPRLPLQDASWKIGTRAATLARFMKQIPGVSNLRRKKTTKYLAVGESVRACLQGALCGELETTWIDSKGTAVAATAGLYIGISAGSSARIGAQGGRNKCNLAPWR